MITPVLLLYIHLFVSGKTHTMMGDENSDGLMLMAIKHIFNEVQSSNIEFVIR